MKPTARQYAETLVAMTHGKARHEQEMQVSRFLAFLRRKRETKKLPAILRALGALVETSSGAKSVEVSLAHEALNDQEALTDLVRRILSWPVDDVRVRIEPELLGGIAVRTRDAVWDGTVRARLRRLRRMLMA